MLADDNPWGNLRPLKHMRYKAGDDLFRQQIVETAVIIDKEYIDQWRKDFPSAKGTFKDLSLWVTDSLNWVSVRWLWSAMFFKYFGQTIVSCPVMRLMLFDWVTIRWV